jgi:membrane protease YdiL (CAAX protease family)
MRRRRVAVATTLVLGAGMLHASLHVRPGDPRFLLLTTALAAVWVVGGLLSGSIPLGKLVIRGRPRRPVLLPFIVGVAVGGFFLAGALVVRAVPALRDFVNAVLAHATPGTLLPVGVVAVVNAVAEEIFFRGALFAAAENTRPVLISSAVYVVITCATGNPMLVFAAAVVAPIFGLQRRASGGVLASTITHATWSLVMLSVLPPLLDA